MKIQKHKTLVQMSQDHDTVGLYNLIGKGKKTKFT